MSIFKQIVVNIIIDMNILIVGVDNYICLAISKGNCFLNQTINLFYFISTLFR